MFIKRFFLSIIACSMLFGSSALVAQQKLKKVLPKKKVVMTFDLDDVLIKKEWGNLSKRIGGVFWHADNKLALLRLFFTLAFYKDCYKAIRKQLRDEHGNRINGANNYIRYFARNYPAIERHYGAIMKAINVHRPIPEMMLVIKKLRDEYGDNLVMGIATNKDRESFDLTLEYLKKQHNQDFNAWMDFSVTADGDKKPQEAYYRRMNDIIQQTNKYSNGSKYVKVFVDDKKKNCDGLNKLEDLGFKSIQFKKAQQVRENIFQTLAERTV